MLTVSPAASAALSDLLEAPDIPDNATVRLVSGQDASGATGIGIVLAEEPAPTDEVVEAAGGLEVFVESQVAEVLEDQELDAELDPEGSRVAFRFQRQATNGGPPGGG